MRRLWTFVAGGLAVSCGASGDFTGTVKPGASAFCTLVGCTEGAYHFGAYPIEGRDVSTLILRACVNATCSETPVSLRPPAWGNCETTLHPWCSMTVRSADNTLQFDINLLPPMATDGRLQPGDNDRYQVSVAVPGQEPWILLRGQAPYTVSYPNGKGCDPECHTIRLQPVQSSGL